MKGSQDVKTRNIFKNTEIKILGAENAQEYKNKDS